MPKTMAAVVQGAAGGLLAGIPQVLLAQVVARLLGLPGEHADIGPRFVHRVAKQVDASPSKEERWSIAAAFHFGYAVWWGVLYGLLQRWRPAQPHVGGPLLGSLIYTLAFSPWGAATVTGTEGPPETRPARESILHWTAALSFSLGLAYLYEQLNKRTRATERPPVQPRPVSSA